MKLLLDENLPVKLINFFSGVHDVSTVQEQGWVGKKNGELIGLMARNGFNGLITIDKNLKYQQNLKKSSIKIYIFNAINNKLQTLKPYVAKLEHLLIKPIEGYVIEINTE